MITYFLTEIVKYCPKKFCQFDSLVIKITENLTCVSPDK
jgi:hypothetical protein